MTADPKWYSMDLFQFQNNYDDPRPQTQRIMVNIEQQSRSDSILIILGGEHTLCNISAAPRFHFPMNTVL